MDKSKNNKREFEKEIKKISKLGISKFKEFLNNDNLTFESLHETIYKGINFEYKEKKYLIEIFINVFDRENDFLCIKNSSDNFTIKLYPKTYFFFYKNDVLKILDLSIRRYNFLQKEK